VDIRAHYQIDDIHLRSMLAATRRDGYAYNNIHVLPGLESAPGMAGIGVPLRRADGRPVAALLITAITARLDGPRRDTVVASMQQEAALLEEQLKPLLGSTGLSERTRSARTAP
jgi:DNA-binding IclR family transcriptional regulator